MSSSRVVATSEDPRRMSKSSSNAFLTTAQSPRRRHALLVLHIPSNVMFQVAMIELYCQGTTAVSCFPQMIGAWGSAEALEVHAPVTAAPISQAKGMKNSPVALVFVGSSLVVYFFGPAGAGDDPNASPVYRAVTSDLSTFVFTSLTNAPSPNVYMQLTTFSDPAPNNGGLGTVILTHVQNDSNRLVSREDDYLSLRLSGRSLDGGGSGRIYICIGQPLAVAVAS
ncbi:uncharacterized protein VDAG_09142 [Verticillium dahliae VdLs.17]|uniref:Uncharacterized protein n=1 Tax=Verticillium dahliae (strain VdLs.17 / ATCC MYA-4575 / FGSC 10137) TaxID=498257 RepID=G2XFL8_VERDV|nr:uncharacterized protein VDAG_09142 [Verticillium dahliae VdLs.17]EGY18616.1 hypothetical protein VDAG_09142 [Verticillium dahliae VdLs.17]KAG7102245.1 hypothetical protein HYQ44_018055 [Verticillium longisporum]